MVTESVARAFNDCITRQDLSGLSNPLADDHILTLDGNRSAGQDPVTEVWAGFFAACLDDDNLFESNAATPDEVVIQGRAICFAPRLDGPTLRRATVRNGRPTGWQVVADTPENRAVLGIEARR